MPTSCTNYCYQHQKSLNDFTFTGMVQKNCINHLKFNILLPEKRNPTKKNSTFKMFIKKNVNQNMLEYFELELCFKKHALRRTEPHRGLWHDGCLREMPAPRHPRQSRAGKKNVWTTTVAGKPLSLANYHAKCSKNFL